MFCTLICRPRLLALILPVACLGAASTAFAEIMSNTSYTVDFTAQETAAKKIKWSDPEHIKLNKNGLGWGDRSENGSRDIWVETTQPIALGLSWRPTSIATIKEIGRASCRERV